jgi:SAM-dependent methyltransferase
MEAVVTSTSREFGAASTPGLLSLASAADQLPVLCEAAPRFWESLTPGWPAVPFSRQLVKSIQTLLAELHVKTGLEDAVLDCGAGTGNPTIGLVLKGVPVCAIDNNPLMLEALYGHCRRTGCREIEIIECDWTEMGDEPHLHSRKFPLVMCRGNALIYVRSWDRELCDAPLALDAARAALRQMYDRLADGGCLYIDVTSDREFNGPAPEPQPLLPVRTPEGDWLLGHWIQEHDRSAGVRRLHACRVRCGPGGEVRELLTYRFSGLLLRRQELDRLLREVGFSDIELRRIDPASHYEELLAWK